MLFFITITLNIIGQCYTQEEPKSHYTIKLYVSCKETRGIDKFVEHMIWVLTETNDL